MDELVRWLGEQLDEDERIARAVQQPDDSRWEAWHMVGEAAEGTVRWGVRGAGVQPSHEDPLNKARMEHIAAHDPARVLREIDADRQLLDEYERLLRAYEAHRREADRLAKAADDDPIRRAALRREADYLPAMVHVLERWAKRKAAVYGDRPGFREEWRP